MTLQQILQLIKQKYPPNIRDGIWPALLIYDDESGGIVKDATQPVYGNYQNFLFEFLSVQELIDHLTAQQSLFDHEN